MRLGRFRGARVRYEVRLTRKAEKQLARLPEEEYRRVSKALLGLENDPRPPNARKLQIREDYRLRIGVYRALYKIEDAQRAVLVTRVGHRRDVYR